jgi:hypothetical protein
MICNLVLNFSNKKRPKGLVNRSATCSPVGIYVSLISPLKFLSGEVIVDSNMLCL